MVIYVYNDSISRENAFFAIFTGNFVLIWYMSNLRLYYKKVKTKERLTRSMKNLAEILKAHEQNELLAAWQSLNAEEKPLLEKQLSEIDWESLSSLIQDYVFRKPETKIPSDLTPADYFPSTPKNEEQKKFYEQAIAAGKKLLSEGKIAILTVAGGQGTRLGFDKPKGAYPTTPILHKTLFQYFAEGLLRTSRKYNTRIPWFIMTSELNDRDTKDFFAEHHFFGLPQDSVVFFTQGVMPAIGYNGKLLLSEKNSLALSPDGHGGTLLALRKSGSLDLMKKAGIEYISYFQVDNPLVPVADPLFIGLHHLTASQMSCRMLPKTYSKEKLGNFCISQGKLQIIEYSDMPDSLAEQRNPDGSLAFIAGSPAIHVISRDFVEELTASGHLNLPWHRADKKVPFIDASGQKISPDAPNAVKLEAFIFDALPLAQRTMLLEGARAEIFGPVKNLTGEDSAETCRAMLIARDARRMQLAGINVPLKDDGSPDCQVEISPLSVIDDEDAVEFFAKNPVQTPVRGSSVTFG